MKKKIDLHTHSTYSDGTLSPADLVDLAKKRKLAALSLTDHDTMAGTAEAVARGREQDVEVIPGIEISSKYNDLSVHILGYGLRPENTLLQSYLDRLQRSRRKRNSGIIARLNQLGIAASIDEVNQAGHGLVGRPHIAQLLVDKKIVKTIDEAFARYLRKGALAFVENPDIFPAGESIRIIKEAGGLAMLAHPGSLSSSLAGITAVIRNLSSMGLDGIEAYYPSHTAATRRRLLQLSEELGLLVCGGTDFHGGIRPGAPLGGSSSSGIIPYDILPAIKERLADRFETG